VYGDPKAGELYLPAELHPYTFIDIPQVKGIRATVQKGEGPLQILARLGADRSALGVFYAYNGGPTRTLHPGDVVHMPVAA
jgi:hypothetical protein